ncbi:MAG: hemolysin family protein [Christensenellales bacterium]|jgi:putative hemolysin
MEADALGIHIFLQVLLFILSGLMQAANVALNTLNISKLKRDAMAEDKASQRLSEAIDKLRNIPSPLEVALVFMFSLLSASFTISYGDMLSNALYLYNVCGENTSQVMLSVVSYLIVLLVLCFIFMLFSIALPKKIVRTKAEDTAKSLLPFIRLVNVLFSPMANLLSNLSSAISRSAGVDPDADVEQVTEDEIRMMVDAGEEKGAIEELERDLIENIFEFNNMTAEECMTHRTDMQSIYIDDSDENIIETIKTTGFSRFPVYQEDLDHIIGVITTRDYLLNLTREKPKKLRNLLRPVRFVPETVRADVLFRSMQEDKIHMAVVVDEYGGTSGIITMEDLLEEIVGNIYDEYDIQEQMDIIEKEKGVWGVSGGTDIEQFNKVTGFELPLDEEYDTIAGFILDNLGAVPEDGSKPRVELEGLIFQVEKVCDRRIEWVEVREIEI